MFLPANITLQFGDSGDFVAELQRRLAAVNAHDENGINGFYDGVTVNSVSSFQSRVGLRADGIAGPETLRKLNGVVSGDTSGDDKKEEEEKRLAQDQMARQFQIMDNQPQFGTLGVPGEAVAVAAALGVGAMALGGAAEGFVSPDAQRATAQGFVSDAQSIQQQLSRENQMHIQQQLQQQSAPQLSQNPGDILAQMLLQQSAAPAQASTQEPSVRNAPLPPEPPRHTPPIQPTNLAQQPAQLSPDQSAAPQQQAQQQPSMVGRAMAKVDAFIQRLAEQFEAKLPPSVLNEVKNIGLTMAQSGVKEVAIPAGPDQARAPATPARGPDQQIPQRG